MVTPKAEEAWAAFAGDLADWVPAEADALDRWWLRCRAARELAA